MTALSHRSTVKVALSTIVLALVGVSYAQAKPVKLQPALHITNDFEYAESTAVAPGGNIYVADRGRHRIQEFTQTGQFVLMFGWDVNETKVKEGAPQEQRNICTATSKDKCQEGTEGSSIEHFDEDGSITVNPSNNDIYVHEFNRVDRYTGEGHFIWELGKKVNQSTGGNLCTAVSKDTCGPGERSPEGSTEHGAFKSANSPGGQQLAFGGPEKLLYVGDEQRVQEFNEEGEWTHDLPLTTISLEPESCVAALTVDASGDIYLAYTVITHSIDGDFIESPHVVREFDALDEEVKSYEVKPREAGIEVEIRGLALDGEGHLAASYNEIGGAGGNAGVLVDAATGRVITKFIPPSGAVGEGLSFDLTKTDANYGYLYLAAQSKVVGYKPVNVAELVATAATCGRGSPDGSDATEQCTLEGEVNPEGVAETEAWFESGLTEALGESVPVPPISVPAGEAPVTVRTLIEGLRPNQPAVRFRVAAFDENSKPPEEPEPLDSEIAQFSTPFVAPAVLGSPSALFVSSSSAVVFAELNPENAATRYSFQYARAAACEEAEAQLGHPVTLDDCPGVVSDTAGESSVYGQIGATDEVTGLQGSAGYRYRLVAVAKSVISGKPETLEAAGPEASFVTGRASTPSAVTGATLAVGETTATISGSVDPDGETASYAFELGVYAGTNTQYGIVFSGPAGATSAEVGEQLGLTSLEPGTSYAYRITVKSGYTPGGEAVSGEPVVFTTLGAPSILSLPEPLPLLTVPAIVFPKEPGAATKPLTRARGRRALTLKACKRKPKPRRARCKRAARRKNTPKHK